MIHYYLACFYHFRASQRDMKAPQSKFSWRVRNVALGAAFSVEGSRLIRMRLPNQR
jgi:hypothetical protein